MDVSPQAEVMLKQQPSVDVEGNPLHERILKLAKDMADNKGRLIVLEEDIYDAVEWYENHGYLN